jgi:hypothetical protein
LALIVETFFMKGMPMRKRSEITQIEQDCPVIWFSELMMARERGQKEREANAIGQLHRLGFTVICHQGDISISKTEGK